MIDEHTWLLHLRLRGLCRKHPQNWLKYWLPLILKPILTFQASGRC